MKGIFIATTNLINNIDSAFDRRLLYKLKFDLPNKDTRYRILLNQFPSVDQKVLKEISASYELSGGQIQNIKRKQLADQIIFGNENTETESLISHIHMEIGFRNKKNQIGFKKFSA
jgi:SpoVK/Ycf46/Vps4 family AAA+-type ATPase